jgi:hypothetical protein
MGEQGWTMATARMREMEDGRRRRAVDLADLVYLLQFKVGPECMVHIRTRFGLDTRGAGQPGRIGPV